MKARYAKESEASGEANSMKAGNLETVLLEVSRTCKPIRD